MLQFSSKAGTLENLRGVLRGAVILESIAVQHSCFQQDFERVLEDCRALGESLIVRSSFSGEDSTDSSHAGEYCSIPCVNSVREDLYTAIEKVFESYGKVDLRNEVVLVQPMLEQVDAAGVVFTADQTTLAPYYLISTDKSGSTGSITSGTATHPTTTVVSWFAVKNSFDSNTVAVVELCEELRQLFQNDYLDIEFAFRDEQLFLLQVRPLVLNRSQPAVEYSQFQGALESVHRRISARTGERPDILGERAIFGVMPDWNPAEIIGIKPRNLALSLYKELVTDDIWAYQRDNYGYRFLRSHPLIISFLGLPYIDVRVSFNSFVPKDIPDAIARKLIAFYLDKLAQFPAYHDKVEFSIVYSCFTLDISNKLKELSDHGFLDSEIRLIELELLQLTQSIIQGGAQNVFLQDIAKLDELQKKFEYVTGSSLPDVEKIYWLVEDCKRYGTLPFAGIARAAFVAMQMLDSFVEVGVITPENKVAFLNSLATVSTELREDLNLVKSGSKDISEFLEVYGHLRPGTYEITSPRYDEDFEGYFNVWHDASSNAESGVYQFSPEQLLQLEEHILRSGLKVSASELVDFIRLAIEQRERAKFLFTRSLSHILSVITHLGISNGISRSDLSHIDIKVLLEAYSVEDVIPMQDRMRQSIAHNRERYAYTECAYMPPLITSALDVYHYSLFEVHPNYITLKAVQGRVTENLSEDLEGAVVCIPSADPGFDFLFTRKIAALVTEFGGRNSHMAIRCAELNIPAVIGVGESLYKQIRSYRLVRIDCQAQQVLRIE